MSPQLLGATTKDAWIPLGPKAGRRYALRSDPRITIARRQYDQEVGRLAGQGPGAIERQRERNQAPKQLGGAWQSIEIGPSVNRLDALRQRYVAPNNDIWIVFYGSMNGYQQKGWLTLIPKTLNKYVSKEDIESAVEKLAADIQKLGMRWRERPV